MNPIRHLPHQKNSTGKKDTSLGQRVSLLLMGLTYLCVGPSDLTFGTRLKQRGFVGLQARCISPVLMPQHVSADAAPTAAMAAVSLWPLLSEHHYSALNQPPFCRPAIIQTLPASSSMRPLFHSHLQRDFFHF